MIYVVIRAADVTGPVLSPRASDTYADDTMRGHLEPHPIHDATLWGARCRLWRSARNAPEVYAEILESYPAPEPGWSLVLCYAIPLVGQLALLVAIWQFARRLLRR